MGLLLFLLLVTVVIVAAVVFVSAYPKYGVITLGGMIVLFLVAYLYLSAPVCQTYARVSEVPNKVSMTAEHLLQNHKDDPPVGNFLFKSPAWSLQGDTVVVCGSRFQKIFAIH